MSDALTDINRDNRMNRLCYVATMLWLNNNGYSSKLVELKNIPRGYCNPRGEKVADIMEKIFSECTGDRFDYLSPKFMEGRYTPDELRVVVSKFNSKSP